LDGPPLGLAALSLPGLNPARRKVLTALARECRTNPAGALGTLGLSPGLASEVARNSRIRNAPTAPAWRVYTGVLFAALDIAGADAATQARLADWALVWSGLWGAVRLTDPIPAYRLSGAVTLPGPGRLASFWREPLRKALPGVTGDGPILDLRSGTYAASWSGPPERTVTVRVVHESGGRRIVASHFNKATKGRLLRALAETSATPNTVEDLLDAMRTAGFRVEPRAVPAGRERALSVDVVVDSL